METLSNVAYDLTPVITAGISLVLAVISCMLIPFIKSRLTEQQFDQLSKWVQIAVAAAEQLFKQPGAGAAKKQYVLSFLQTKGYNLDDEKVKSEVNTLVENAVYDLNNTNKHI